MMWLLPAIQEAENHGCHSKSDFQWTGYLFFFFPLYLNCDAGALPRQGVVKSRKQRQQSALQDAPGETACCWACASGAQKLFVKSRKHISGSEINKIHTYFYRDM